MEQIDVLMKAEDMKHDHILKLTCVICKKDFWATENEAEEINDEGNDPMCDSCENDCEE